MKITEDVTPDNWAAKRRGKVERSKELYRCNGVPFKLELETELEILEDLRYFNREDKECIRFELVDLPMRLRRECPITS